MTGMKVPTNVSIVRLGARKLVVEATLPRDGTSCLSLPVWAYRWTEVSLDGVVSPDAWIERSEYSEPIVAPQPLYIPRRQAEVAYAKTWYTSTTFLREARKPTTHTGAGGAHFCLWYELAGWLVDTVPGGGIHRARTTSFYATRSRWKEHRPERSQGEGSLIRKLVPPLPDTFGYAIDGDRPPSSRLLPFYVHKRADSWTRRDQPRPTARTVSRMWSTHASGRMSSRLRAQ